MNLLLHGNWRFCSEVVVDLLHAGFTLDWGVHTTPSVLGSQSSSSIDVYLLTGNQDLPQNQKGWVGWDVSPEGNLTLPAYQCGAAVVFPRGISSAELINSLHMLFPAVSAEAKPSARNFPANAIIFLESDQVLLVEDGVVATFIIHRDGKQTLTGLTGSGQVVLPHPADDCHLELIAYTAVRASLFDWPQIGRQPEFIQSLRRRLYLTEAWASAQARPYLEDRLLGILKLLAEQFGKPDAQGSLIDLRLTHQLLASAIGANRTTITRLLANLKQRGLLRTAGRGKNERLILTQPATASHT
ncbi:Crp/Fnr family transcriptional regulator [Bellilinea sp.]|jgi:hypothetical protein